VLARFNRHNWGSPLPYAGGVSSDDQGTLENEVLGGLRPVERMLFAPSIRRNIQKDKSRFCPWLPKYGPIGAATLIAANLWLLPALSFLILAVVLNIATGAHSTVRVLSYVLFGLFLVSIALMLVGAMRASRMGRQYRESTAD
jgi:hypothetical protein